jgi:hypothetical protein
MNKKRVFKKINAKNRILFLALRGKKKITLREKKIYTFFFQKGVSVTMSEDRFPVPLVSMRERGCKRELDTLKGMEVGYLQEAQCAGCRGMFVVTHPEKRKQVLGELCYMCGDCLCKIHGNDQDTSDGFQFTGWQRNAEKTVYTPCRSWIEDEIRHQEALLELVQGRLKRLKDALLE